MTDKTEFKIISIGWYMSIWSDIQTWMFIVSIYAINFHLLGNSGWMNFIAFILAIMWVWTRSAKIKGKYIFHCKTPDEAIETIKNIRKNSPATSDAAIGSGMNAVLRSQDGQESAPDRGAIFIEGKDEGDIR